MEWTAFKASLQFCMWRKHIQNLRNGDDGYGLEKFKNIKMYYEI